MSILYSHYTINTPNEESLPAKKKSNMSTLSMSDHLKMCGWTALIGFASFGGATYGIASYRAGADTMINVILPFLPSLFSVVSLGGMIALEANPLRLTGLVCWAGSGFLTYYLVTGFVQSLGREM